MEDGQDQDSKRSLINTVNCLSCHAGASQFERRARTSLRSAEPRGAAIAPPATCDVASMPPMFEMRAIDDYYGDGRVRDGQDAEKALDGAAITAIRRGPETREPSVRASVAQGTKRKSLAPRASGEPRASDRSGQRWGRRLIRGEHTPMMTVVVGMAGALASAVITNATTGGTGCVYRRSELVVIFASRTMWA